MSRDKAIDRIRKLLAMSKDASSPNEAAIAARRARKIMDEYQISELDLTAVEDSDFGTEAFNMKARQTNKPLGILAVAVADLNDVYAEYASKGGYKHIVFKGLLVDAVTATEMFKWLRDIMYRYAENHADGRADRFAYRLGFASGVAKKVREILKERQQLKTSDGKGLMVVKQALVKQHFKVRPYKRNATTYSGSQQAYRSGESQGYRTNLDRQVQGQQQGRIGN